MSTECLTWFECQSNDSIASHFVYRIYCLLLHNHGVRCYKTSSREQTIQKYKALRELERGTPHKDVASLFRVPKNTLSTWKKDSLYSKLGEAMMRSFKELNSNVDKEYVFDKKQTLISNFFLKQQMLILHVYMLCFWCLFTPLSIKIPMTPTLLG